MIKNHYNPSNLTFSNNVFIELYFSPEISATTCNKYTYNKGKKEVHPD